MPIVNNVTRLLDARKVLYTALQLPAEKLGALEVAGILKVDPATVFKTIVVTRDRPKRPLLVLVPATAEVDLKQVASTLGEKKVHLPSEREAEELTGLEAGGISPLALMNKGFQVLLDSTASAYPQIHISGGQRGLNIRLGVSDLVQLTGARVAPLARAPQTPSVLESEEYS